MQFRLWSAIIIFLGSYAPLALILLVQDVSERHWGASVCGWQWSFDCTFQIFDHPLAALGGVVVTWSALGLTIVSLKSVRLKTVVDVLEVKSIPNDLINYVFPYIVSFMGLNYSDPQKIAGFLVFWAGLFIITYRSGQIIMNPLLIVLGWQLYEVKMLVGGRKYPRMFEHLSVASSCLGSTK